jgi:hypothetical protein
MDLPDREGIVKIKRNNQLMGTVLKQAVLYGIDILDFEALSEKSFYE